MQIDKRLITATGLLLVSCLAGAQAIIKPKHLLYKKNKNNFAADLQQN